MNFTACQQIAYDQITAWLISPLSKHKKENIFVLSGAAGTGKTYMLNQFHSFLEKVEEVNKTLGIKSEIDSANIYYTATTNNAVEELAKNTHAACYAPCTVHKFFGLRLRKNMKTGENYIKYSDANSMYSTKKMLLIIDEASMLDTDMLNLIETYAIYGRILLVGDFAQLPPVKEDLPLFTNNGYKMVDMTTNVRSANNPHLQKLINDYRENIYAQNPFKDTIPVCKKLTGKEFAAQLLQDFSTGQNSKYLAYTNKAVIGCNNYYKNALTGTSGIQEKDILIVYSVPHNSDLKLLSEMYIEKVIDTVYTISLTGHLPLDIPCYSVNQVWYVAKDLKQVELALVFLREEYEDYEPSSNYAQKIMGYITVLESSFVDLRPCYAMTITRSQGQTFKNVYLDLSTLSFLSKKPYLQTRMLYVAISRATDNVYITGEL